MVSRLSRSIGICKNAEYCNYSRLNSRTFPRLRFRTAAKSCRLKKKHERADPGRSGPGIAVSPEARFGDHMNPQETFVTRLRRQRMRARVSLEEIADSLRDQAGDHRGVRGQRSVGVAARASIRARGFAPMRWPSISIPSIRWTNSAVCFRRAIAVPAARFRRSPPSSRRPRSTATSSAILKVAAPATRAGCGQKAAAWHAFVTQPSRALWPADRA